MKKISLMTLALVAGFASVSEAKISQYATGKVSLNSVKSEFESNMFASGTMNMGGRDTSVTVTNNDSMDADDMGAGLSVGYGLDFGNGFRSDVELSYNSLTKDNGMSSGNQTVTFDGTVVPQMSGIEYSPAELQTKSTTLMLNGYYDIKTGTEWTPYVTAGVGYAHVDNITKAENGTNVSKYRADNFAYQAGVGVSYALTSNIALDAGYKYVDLGKTEQKSFGTGTGIPTQESKETTNTMNQFSIGARMAF